MTKEAKHRYAINFDLTIKQLETYYSKTNPKGAYKKIARYMYTHGFSHRQWSGYISDKTMTKTELIDFTLGIHKEFPWLINCEGSMDATVITSIFDIKQMILDTMNDDDDNMELEQRISLARFSAWVWSPLRHISTPPQCDPAERFCFLGNEVS